MNFKTTIILIVLLLAAGVAVYFTNQSPPKEQSDDTSTATPKKLLDFNSSDVNQLVIEPQDGKRIVLKREGTQWNLTEPVSAPAEMDPPSEILSDLAAMASTGRVAAEGADAAATGLSPPQFKLEIDTNNGKSIKLDIGSRSGTGDQLYVHLDGDSRDDLVQADVYDLLDKSAGDFRRKKLLDVTSDQVQQLEVDRPEGNLVLEKIGANWVIKKPSIMPGENSAVTDLIMGLSGLTANNFVSETDPDPRRYGLDQPTLRVSYSTTPASTQPTNSPGESNVGETVVKFGMLDVRKQNVYVSTSDNTSVALVPVNSMDAFKKSALDLRDKDVLNVDPASVSGIAVHTSLSATTKPTTRPASDWIVAIQRRSAPTTLPATGASTAPATAPVKRSLWQVANASFSIDAADAKVDALLAALHPLKVQQYDAAPTTAPATADRYTVTISCPPPLISSYKIELTDRGDSRPLIGRYNDLAFEVDRSLLDKFKTDFTHADEPAPVPSASPSFPPGAGPTVGPSGP
jgi:hypothetical protein